VTSLGSSIWNQTARGATGARERYPIASATVTSSNTPAADAHAIAARRPHSTEVVDGPSIGATTDEVPLGVVRLSSANARSRVD
jgi:hypothetical protein